MSANPTPLDLYLRSLGIQTVPPPLLYQLPLQQFSNGIQEQTVNISINANAYVFYFQNNIIENNLFISCYDSTSTNIYFGSFRCSFGNYINLVPEIPIVFPYLLFFYDSTQKNYQNITFDTLNNGVQLYAKPR